MDAKPKKKKASDDDEEASLLDNHDEDDEGETDEDEPRHVPADSLPLAVKNDKETMCDVLRGKKKKLALFSFTAVDCEDCMKRAGDVAQGVKDLGLEGDVLPVVVVTGDEDEMSADEWTELKEETAPDAVWGFDKTGEVWKFFAGAKMAAKGVEPWVLVMDVYATGFLDKEAEHDVAHLVEDANRMLDLELEWEGGGGGGGGDRPSTSTGVSTGTRTGTSTGTATGTGTATKTTTGTGTGTGAGTGTRTGTSTATATVSATGAVTATLTATGTATATAAN
jgi:hypothetical protein